MKECSGKRLSQCIAENKILFVLFRQHACCNTQFKKFENNVRKFNVCIIYISCNSKRYDNLFQIHNSVMSHKYVITGSSFCPFDFKTHSFHHRSDDNKYYENAYDHVFNVCRNGR